jgi:hypothetical protein
MKGNILAVRKRIDKSRWTNDAAMSNRWFLATRAELRAFFGDIESVRRYYWSHVHRADARSPSESWWEAFGPEELRLSACDQRHFTIWAPKDCSCGRPSVFRPDSAFEERRRDWLAENYPNEFAGYIAKERTNV